MQDHETKNARTFKFGFKELLNKEQIGNSEPFPCDQFASLLNK